MIITQEFKHGLTKAHTPTVKISFDPNSQDPVSYSLKSGRMWATDLVEISSAFLHPNSTIVDIGTHIGTFSALACCITKKKVISIEPEPNNFQLLYSNKDNNNFDYQEVYNVAASNSEGVIRFCPNGPSSHILQEGGTEAAIEVKSVTVDSIINGQPVDFIKIDVEGWEINTLKGLQKTIRDSQPVIVFEVNGFTLKWFDHTPNTLIRYIEELDYQVFALAGNALIPISSYDPFPFGVIDCFALSKRHIPYIQRQISLPLSFCDREAIYSESVYRGNSDMKEYFRWYESKFKK